MPTKPSDTDRRNLTSNSSMKALAYVIIAMGILFFGCIFGTVIYLVYFM